MFSTPPPVHPPIRLNCFILGHDPSEIFSIEIAHTNTVSELRELIKDKNRDVFHDVPACCLCFWDVSISMDDTLECSLNNLTLDPKKCLSPVAEMFKVFEDPPLPNHLHIVIQHPLTSELSI